MEVVGNEPALMYDREDDAVEKILAVMADAAEQARLRDGLAATSDQFSTARFVQHVRRIVADFRE
jgi:hypothetical protein